MKNVTIMSGEVLSGFSSLIHKKTQIEPEGIFVCRSWTRQWDQGQVIGETFGDPFIKHNLVVNTGRDYAARIFFGAIHNFVNNLKLGTDPTPTNLADIDLHATIWPGPGQVGQFDSYSFPAVGQGTGIKRITGNEFGTEYAITEAGIFFNDGVLLDRAILGNLSVHPTNVDNIEVGLEISWSVIF